MAENLPTVRRRQPMQDGGRGPGGPVLVRIGHYQPHRPGGSTGGFYRQALSLPSLRPD